MFDFFDEDFPLTKKQEEEYKKRLAEEAEALNNLAMNIAEEAESATADEAAQADEAIRSAEAEEPAESAASDQSAEPDESPAQAYGDVVIENLPTELFAPVEDDGEDVDEAQSASDAGEAYARQLAEIMDSEPAPEQPEEIGGETDDGELPDGENTESAEDIEPAPEMTSYDEMFDDEADDGELLEDGSEDDDEPSAEEEVLESELDAAEDAQTEPSHAEESAEASPDEAEEESVMPTPADFDLSEEDFAVSPDVFAFDDSLASIDALEQHLREELKSLGEKLESMERVVDNMEDADIAEGFDYEYDERYFAIEETPAYLHPEMYRPSQSDIRFDDEFEAAAEPVLEPSAEQEPETDSAQAEPTIETVEPLADPKIAPPAAEKPPCERVERLDTSDRIQTTASPRRTAKTAPAKAKDSGKDININISSSALIKAGAAVAAAAIAYKLMGGRSNDKGKGK